LKKRKRTKLGKDKRRKHKHWQVTVFYKDGEKFARVYTDRAKASKFAERQRKSPVVKTARVLQVSYIKQGGISCDPRQCIATCALNAVY